MPRPLKEDPRDVFKTFRFTHAEVTRLEGRARASGHNLSSYVRMLLLDRPGDEPVSELMVKAPAPANAYQSGVAVLIEQIRKLGVNLNQIAHRMNERRSPPPRELTMLIDDIRGYVREARDL
jgi:Bacterial mobilisation protein (MobC)